MAVSDSFLGFVLEQLEELGNVSARRMFGGVGLYSGDLFFAVLDNDTLFFKVDETNVTAFVDAGMGPFRPYPDKPEASMSYYQVPVSVLEDRDEIVAWAGRAVEVSRSARRSRPRRRSRSARNPTRKRSVKPPRRKSR